jgi:DNA mismatch repair protein MSH6
MIIQAVGNTVNFLDGQLVAESTVGLSEFTKYDHNLKVDNTQTHMLIDSQALENLEILETQNKSLKTTEGSLYNFVNKCQTAFGARMLRSWIIAPLFQKSELAERHNAVEWLINNPDVMEDWGKKFKSTPDLENLLVKMYKFSIQADSKAIYIDSSSVMKLNEFFVLLENLEMIIKSISDIFHGEEDYSKRLHQLSHFKKRQKGKEKYKSANPLDFDPDENVKDGMLKTPYNYIVSKDPKSGGLLPDIRVQLERFRSVITWKNIDNKKVPEPKEGLDEGFDKANKAVEDVHNELYVLLEKVQEELNTYKEISYNTESVVHRFQFEIIKESKAKVPNDYEKTSSTLLVNRYQSPELKKLIEKLRDKEYELKEGVKPFLKKLFRKFYEKRQMWSTFVRCIGEIDCLVSLASVSYNTPNMVKPEILDSDKATIIMDQLRHPCVEQTVKNFVPNNVSIGGNEPLVHLITGPNMGGKSTLLRMT